MVAITDVPYNVPTIQQFRDENNAFADRDKYPDPTVQRFLNVAASTLDVNRWGEYWVLGIYNWTMHMLKMGDLAKGPGGGIGVVTSKSLGPGSIGYDNNMGAEANAGQWNMTMYGRLFIYYARLVGMGGVQINPYPVQVNTPFSSDSDFGPIIPIV
jgi:hypothetical protein